MRLTLIVHSKGKYLRSYSPRIFFTVHQSGRFFGIWWDNGFENTTHNCSRLLRFSPDPETELNSGFSEIGFQECAIGGTLLKWGVLELEGNRNYAQGLFDIDSPHRIDRMFDNGSSDLGNPSGYGRTYCRSFSVSRLPSDIGSREIVKQRQAPRQTMPGVGTSCRIGSPFCQANTERKNYNDYRVAL